MGEAASTPGTRPGRSTLEPLRRRLHRSLRLGFRSATWPLHALYERRLTNQISHRPPPRHVGIILDGNRRYAVREGLAHSREAYQLGAQKLDEVIAWCIELAIPAVTLWVCSPENFGRSADQVAGILAAIEDKVRALVDHPDIHQHRIRVQAIGRLEQLPERTRESIRSAEHATAGYDGMLLTIAVAYGGREEIADAVRSMLLAALNRGETLADAAASVSPEAIARHLYLASAPEPDLIIRTSGEVRLSGFLLWQSASSEFYFSEALWPAFRKIDFMRAIRSFQERSRRFGR